jgi:hypothetical protein
MATMHVCTECDRLWKEYAEATKAYMKIISNQQIASLQHDLEVMAKLEPILREARERRESARRTLKDHEATHDKGDLVMHAS